MRWVTAVFSGCSCRSFFQPAAVPVAPSAADELDFKRVRGGMLVQTRMHMEFPETAWKVVTSRSPDEQEMNDLRFGWKVCAAVKSNAIVLVHDQRTLGIGAGQMSRVDSSRIAVMKAHDQGASLTGAAASTIGLRAVRESRVSL